jgi:hypothetical protein
MAYNVGRDIGKLESDIESLAEQVAKLSTQVEALNAVLNKGRGVQFALLLIPGFIGVAVTILGYFGIKLTIGG